MKPIRTKQFYRKGRPPKETADLRLEGKGRKENIEIISNVGKMQGKEFLFCKKFVFITTFLWIIAQRYDINYYPHKRFYRKGRIYWLKHRDTLIGFARPKALNLKCCAS